MSGNAVRRVVGSIFGRNTGSDVYSILSSLPAVVKRP
jgi:coproporphyrinogen III oxidase